MNNPNPIETKDVTVPSGMKDPAVIQQAVKNEGEYSKAGLAAGLTCIVLGVILFILGVTGFTSSWTVQLLGFQSALADATPGALLFVIGVVIIFMTKHKVKTESKQTPAPPTPPPAAPQSPAQPSV